MQATPQKQAMALFGLSAKPLLAYERGVGSESRVHCPAKPPLFLSVLQARMSLRSMAAALAVLGVVCSASTLLAMASKSQRALASLPLHSNAGFNVVSNETRLRRSGSASAMVAADVDPFTCWSDTGGTCHIEDCSPSRGPTTCSSGGCVCKEGFCSGPDGSCYPEANQLVVDKFSLRSVKWPNLYLISDSCGPTRMQLLERNPVDQGEFALYRLPPSSSKDPEYFWKVRSQSNCIAWIHTGGFQSLGSNSDQLQASHPDVSGAGPRAHAFKFEKVPQYPGAVKIAYQTEDITGTATAWEYLYASHMALDSSLYLYDGDPGPQGYFYPDPPLDVL